MKNPEVKITDNRMHWRMKKHGITGVTLGWPTKPGELPVTLCFDGDVLFGKADRIMYPQYFKDGEWPTDPVTKEKLPIHETKQRRK